MDKFIEIRPSWYNGDSTTLLNVDQIVKVVIINEETYLIRTTNNDVIELPMDDYNMSVMTQVFNLKVGE